MLSNILNSCLGFCAVRIAYRLCGKKLASMHRVDRVLSFFSSRRNRDSHPSHSRAGEGVGGPNSDEGTDTVVYVLGVSLFSFPFPNLLFKQYVKKRKIGIGKIKSDSFAVLHYS
jgi:hypothetical protein